MRTKFYIVACVFFLILMQGVYAQSCGLLEEKIYLNPNQIAFHDSKIYVQWEEQIFTVPAIYSNQNGFYIPIAKQPRGRCEPFEWKCPNPRCGRCNDLRDDICPSCGTEMQ